MKWLIDLQSLKIFAFATRHQCLHRVTLMSYTQHSNLLPLLTAEQGYFLEQIWRIFAPFFNNQLQNGAYIYWRRSDNFSRRYMLFIYVLEGYFKVNLYKEGHFWAQCLLPFVDSQSTRRSKRSVKRNAGATSALDKIRFEVNFFKICKFIIFNFLPIAYESNDQFIHVLGNFVRQASEQSLR